MDKRMARQMADVRALLLEWDAIGVADVPSCQDEYDCMIGPLLGHLRSGSDAVFIRDWIARERVDHFGLNKDNGRDRALADKLLSWWSIEAVGEVSDTLRSLEAEVESVAQVERVTHGAGIEGVSVTPSNSDARSIGWTYLGDEIVLEVGTNGGRWELERSVKDVSFMTDVVRSVVAGRIREVLGPNRSRVEVTLSDGTTVVETGYSSILPSPGWRRRGKKVQYAPYAR